MLILRGHRANATIWSVAFSPDGALLASCGTDSTARLWNLSDGSHRVLASDIYSWSLAFAPDGSELTVASPLTSTTAQWSLPDGPRRLLPAYLRKVSYAPDGSLLAGEQGATLHLWDRRGQPGQRRIHNTAWIGALGFSPDSKTLALGHFIKHLDSRWEQWIALYDPATLTEQGRLTGHSATANHLAFSPDGSLLVVGAGQSLYVQDVRRRQLLTTLKFDSRHFQAVAFTPDGRFLAAARNDRTVRFLEVGCWRQAAAFDWDIGPLVSLAFSADGMRAAAGSKRGAIIVWDVDL
jgi:WD40 repeat protein